MFILVLDETEYKTLEWLADRGYDADLLALVDDQEEWTDSIVLKWNESSLHMAQDAVDSDPHAFLTCCGSDSLRRKLLALLDKVC